MTSEAITYTFRTICVTEYGWISMTATTMEDDLIDSVVVARAENLLTLQGQLRKEPPRVFMLPPPAWREPHDDMVVTVSETLIKQDLMSGKALSEREMEKYEIPFQYMGA